MILDKLPLQLTSERHSATSYTGGCDIGVEHILNQTIVACGMQVTLLVHYNLLRETGTAVLCLKYNGNQRSIAKDLDKHKVQLWLPVHDTLNISVTVGFDEQDILKQVRKLTGEDDHSHIRWVLERGFANQANPLAMLRKLMPGDWCTHRGHGSEQDTVEFNGQLVWTGRMAQTALQ